MPTESMARRTKNPKKLSAAPVQRGIQASRGDEAETEGRGQGTTFKRMTRATEDTT